MASQVRGSRAATPNFQKSAALRGKRIALFSGNYNYVRDGANQALNRLVAHLEKNGAKVRVYSPTTDTPAFAPAGTLVSAPSIALPGRGEYRLALGLPRAIKQDLQEFDPHLVHLSAPDWLGTKALSFAKLQLRVPVIASLHTRFERYLDHYGLGFLRRIMEGHLQRFYDGCDLVLVPNRSIQAEMTSDVDGRIQVWGRGVDGEMFAPARRSMAWRCEHGFTDSDIVLLFFGRLVLEKGTNHFANMARALMKVDRRIRPLIIGDGPVRAKMAASIPEAVFTGQLTGIELATAVASADIMLNPSLSEAFGNVNLEAMASGLTIVAADCESSRNLIVHGQNGWLCDTTCFDTWPVDILELVQNAKRRALLGENAVSSAKRHEWSNVLDGVVEVYSEILTFAASKEAANPVHEISFLQRQVTH